MAETNSAPIDFIGKLPDAVLLDIIDRLPFKESARTSLLSTRWRRLLPPSRILDLDQTNFVPQNGTTFVEFARNLINTRQRESTIDKFSLTLSAPFPPDELRHCLSFAVQKKAKVILLDFSASTNVSFDLPMDVYGHQTLQTLTLLSCNFIGSQCNRWHSLLHLSLGWMKLHPASLTDLVRNCVSLKSLRLKKCTNIVEIRGQPSGLQSLVIEDSEAWISVRAPNLKIFNYRGKFCNLELDSMHGIEEAVIDFGDESEYGLVGDLLCQLFKDLYAVQKLSVCSFTLQSIASGEEALGLRPRLKKVKELKLKSRMHENEFYGIRFLLDSCPCLERLTIEVDSSRRVFEEYERPLEERWDAAMPVYRCVSTTLEVVEVKGLRGNSDEIGLLAYFVVAGRCMQKLNVKVESPEPEWVQRATNILLRLHKASPQLRINIS